MWKIYTLGMLTGLFFLLIAGCAREPIKERPEADENTSDIPVTGTGLLVINEAVSSNNGTITDTDDDTPDWIEIYNPGNTAINLEGFGLSDDDANLLQWVFPNISLDAKQHLLVFASGKDLTALCVPSCLHTNFKISAGGETILLTQNDGTLLDRIETGELDTNVSVGRYPDGASDFYLFETPTPGTSNTSPTTPRN